MSPRDPGLNLCSQQNMRGLKKTIKKYLVTVLFKCITHVKIDSHLKFKWIRSDAGLSCPSAGKRVMYL